MRRFCILAAMLLFLLGFAFTAPIEVRTAQSFICDTTGSRYGYQTWFFGARTSTWYQKSALETFVEARHRNELQHRWSAHGNTGKDIFGRNVVFRCGARPPLWALAPDLISAYCAAASDEEKLHTYRALLQAI